MNRERKREEVKKKVGDRSYKDEHRNFITLKLHNARK